MYTGTSLVVRGEQIAMGQGQQRLARKQQDGARARSKWSSQTARAWLCARLSSAFRRPERPRHLIMGLSQSGKSSVLCALRACHAPASSPTLRRNLDKIPLEANQLLVLEVPSVEGTDVPQLRVADTHGVAGLIFVLDTTNHTRIDEAREMLQRELTSGPFSACAQKLIEPATCMSEWSLAHPDQFTARIPNHFRMLRVW